MKCKVTLLARESNGLCPLLWFIREGIQVITQLSTKQDYENNSCTQFVPEVQNLCIKEGILFTRLLCSNDFTKSPPFLTLAIKLCIIQC